VLIQVRIEEPKCATCGYCLLMLKSANARSAARLFPTALQRLNRRQRLRFQSEKPRAILLASRIVRNGKAQRLFSWVVSNARIEDRPYFIILHYAIGGN